MRRRFTTPQALRDARKAAGLTQTQLAELVGCGRHAVSYWETKAGPIRATHNGVPRWIVDALGIAALPDYPTTTRTRGDGVLAWTDSQQAALDRQSARTNAKIEAKNKRHRQPCGAQTRKGAPCRNLSEPGRRRCKFHGGRSTGPTTPEGKARIAEAQRLRWHRWRLQGGNGLTLPSPTLPP